MPHQTLQRDYRRSATDVLACPICAVPLALDSLRCPECGLSAHERDSIVSFRPVATGPAEPPDLETLALLTEQGSIREAAAEWLEGRPDEAIVRAELFDVGRESWRPLVADRVTGRCLDLRAGFGRRSMLLAALAETVYAVDPSLSKLRVAAARNDFQSANDVVPVHANAGGLPFASGAFETIVTDVTGVEASLEQHLETVVPYLDDGGTVLALVDGWPRRTGLLGSSGGDANGPTLDSIRQTTPSGFRSLGVRFGFDRVSTYALVPSAARPLYVFDVENADAVNALAETVFEERPLLEPIGNPLVSLADRAGLLKRSYPSYLVVYEAADGVGSPEAGRTPPAADGSAVRGDGSGTSRDDGSGTSRDDGSGASEGPRSSALRSNDFTQPMAISGRARSVVLELDGGDPTTVWKVPNRAAHEPLTKREHDVLEYLRSRDETFADTLPAGSAVHSRVGTCRRERPVSGRSLDATLGEDPASFERVLRLGFEWLIDFQRACGGDTVVRSPEQVREDLRFEPAGLEPPEIVEPVETFYTPVHGDFSAQNVYAEDDRVTGVIDWEYGALEANPIVDAAFLVLDAAAQAFGDFHDGARSVLCADTEHAAHARTWIDTYCEAVGIPPRTFAVYLPAVYVHRLRLDWRFDATSTYSGRMDDRADVAAFLFELRESGQLDRVRTETRCRFRDEPVKQPPNERDSSGNGGAR